MDWEMKASSRDHLTELAAIDGSGSLEVANNGGGFSMDLKLGGSGDKLNLKEAKGPTKTVSSPSGSSKKTQNVSCSVDGCSADLSKCREYHRRHRVCERHSKTPVVTVRGKELRFCQQCSRFQSLGEFDNEKRSCRRRLDGHNRRRRKPQPQPFYVGSTSGSYLSTNQGTRFLLLSRPESSTMSMAESSPTWLPGSGEQRRIRNSVLGDKRFPFLLDSDQEVPEETSSDGVIQPPPLNSGSALSLLSTHHQTQTLTPATIWSNLVQQDVINHHNQTVGGNHCEDLVQYSSSEGMEMKPPVLVPQLTNTSSNLLCSQMFQMAPDDLLGKGTF